MANLTLSGWKASVAAGVVETVPLQDFQSALVLAEDFLATQGGWQPDDALDPTGPGVPASGVSLEDSILLIGIDRIGRVYHVDVTGTLNFRIKMNENFPQGLTDQEVFDNIAMRLDDLVEANFAKTTMAVEDVTSFGGTVTAGPTTQSDRADIQNQITSGGRLIDPLPIGLNAARASFNLDNTFNVEYIYTEPNKALFISVIKYTDTVYQTVEPGQTQKYAITLDPVSYKTTGGTVVPIQAT